MPINTRYISDIYRKNQEGAGIAASAIEGSATDKLPADALPADVVTADQTGLTHSDAGTVLVWRQGEADSAGTIDFAEVVGADGAAATYDPDAGELKVSGQFTTDEVAEGKQLFGDIRARGFEPLADARISAVNGRGNVPYTNAQARTYSSWRANGGVASNTGPAQENRNFIVETRREYAAGDPKFRVVTLTDDGELGNVATLTPIGSNLAGDRYYYNANFARLAAGGGETLNVAVRPANLELENVDIPAGNISGVLALNQLPHLGNIILNEGA